jgi:hypothetical protein
MRARFRSKVNFKTNIRGFSGEINDVADPNLFDKIERLYGAGNLRKQVVIGFRIFSREKRRRTK